MDIFVSGKIRVELGFCTFHLDKEEALQLAVQLVSAADGKLIDCTVNGVVSKWNESSAFFRAYAAFRGGKP